jgi:regulator of replication initiation timing
MDNLEKEILFENLREYMQRSTLIFSLNKEKKIDKEESYDKLHMLWEEFFKSANHIFKANYKRTKDNDR